MSGNKESYTKRMSDFKQCLGHFPGLKYHQLVEMNIEQYNHWKQRGRWEYTDVGLNEQFTSKTLYRREWSYPEYWYMKYKYENEKLYLVREYPMMDPPKRSFKIDYKATEL